MQNAQLKSAPDKIWDLKRNKRIGEIYLEIGDIENAQKTYLSLINNHPKTPGGYIGLADCYERKGDIQKAIEYQERAIIIVKTTYEYIPKISFKKELQKLADLYKKSGQQDLADKVAQEIASIK